MIIHATIVGLVFGTTEEPRNMTNDEAQYVLGTAIFNISAGHQDLNWTECKKCILKKWFASIKNTSDRIGEEDLNKMYTFNVQPTKWDPSKNTMSQEDKRNHDDRLRDLSKNTSMPIVATPLYAAVLVSGYCLAEQLIEEGADPNFSPKFNEDYLASTEFPSLKTKEGLDSRGYVILDNKSPIQLANDMKDERMLSILRKEKYEQVHLRVSDHNQLLLKTKAL